MHIRSLIAASLFLVPLVSTASDGMMFGVVYECEADEINRVMVETCSSRFPELAKDADEALAAWRGRNSAKAEAAANACFTRVAAAAGNAAPSDREAVRKLIADTKEEISAGFEARIRKQGMAACQGALKQLQTAGGPLEVR